MQSQPHRRVLFLVLLASGAFACLACLNDYSEYEFVPGAEPTATASPSASATAGADAEVAGAPTQ